MKINLQASLLITLASQIVEVDSNSVKSDISFEFNADVEYSSKPKLHVNESESRSEASSLHLSRIESLGKERDDEFPVTEKVSFNNNFLTPIWGDGIDKSPFSVSSINSRKDDKAGSWADVIGPMKE